jgi:hypothetical protein
MPLGRPAHRRRWRARRAVGLRPDGHGSTHLAAPPGVGQDLR